MKLQRLLAPIGAVALVVSAHAQVSLGGTTYTQDFDSLPASGNTLTWVNDSSLAGWFLFDSAGVAAGVGNFRADTGSVNTGLFVSYGSTAASDRALGATALNAKDFSGGTVANGADAAYIAVALTNNSGGDFGSFSISYTGEQWRIGTTTVTDTTVLQYGFGATYAAVSWTAPGGTFDFTSPQTGAGTATAIDGNASGNFVSGLGGTLGALWADGTTLWVRWVDVNVTAGDNGLAIDNLTITGIPGSSAVPEPSTWTLLTGFAVFGFAFARRRSRD